MTSQPPFNLERFREVADLADMASRPEGGSRHWLWHGIGGDAYPQRIIRDGDVVLVAETFEGPGDGPEPVPPRFAEHIATFDPPTVLALVEIAAALAADLERFNDEILTNRGWRVCIACGELSSYRGAPCVRCGEREQDFEAVAFRPGWDATP